MSNTESSSTSSSISLIKLDELSSFGATKQNRLPALIKLNDNIDEDLAKFSVNSMPTFSASEIEQQSAINEKKQQSLPIHLQAAGGTIMNKTTSEAEKENVAMVVVTQQREIAQENRQKQQQLDGSSKETSSKVIGEQKQAEETTLDSNSGDFQVVDMEQVADEQVTESSSLPQLTGGFEVNNKEQSLRSHQQSEKSIQALHASQLFNQQQPTSVTHLGDSLIEMIINLRNENQNLIRAIETNNDYVKERLSEFKKAQEESHKREAQFALEKAEHEHQIRKLQRQNAVLSERLKSMECKLKEMKLDVSDTLNAAHSSKASSIRQPESNLYPELATDLEAESFSNSALNNHQAATTMQIDATNGDQSNNDDKLESSSYDPKQHTATVLEIDNNSAQASRIANMSKEELADHFDAEKVKFYALDDPMKQCDKLEQQLNDIGKRDYEICLLQQQLNIYRQDFRLERMANLEAKIQIEKLKNDIDKLCLERLQVRASETTLAKELASGSRGNRYEANLNQDNLIGRLGRKAAKSAAKSAAKAAKYAAKQAHLEERAAKAMARVAGTSACYRQQETKPQATSTSTNVPSAETSGSEPTQHYRAPQTGYSHHHGHHHRHHQHRPRSSGIGSEVVNDLLSTANKAMLTGYKMASTHVNLALDKLSQYEQEQRVNLEKNKHQQPDGNPNPSAPQMQPPSID